MSKTMLNIADVYEEYSLESVHPQLALLKEVDKHSGYRTKQMLAVPTLDRDELLGVLQVINNKSDAPFGDLGI